MRIAIAGAGIGGLTAAALLAQRGHDVQVFDQFDAPRPVGSGLVIQPVGQHVLSVMGALTCAQAKGAPIHRMLGHTPNGRAVLDVTYDRQGAGRAGLAIHRASLFDVLHRSALAAGARIVPQARVTGSDCTATGRNLYSTLGQHGPFDLVIDSSGVSSALSPLRARPLPYGAIWGVVPWPDQTPLPYTQLRQRYLAATNMVGILPIGSLPDATTPMAALFWSLPRDSYDNWRAAPLQHWKHNATQLWPDIAAFLPAITDHDQMTMARYSHGTLARPVGPRLAIIGDAAHRASPQLGQGANMALLDAYALVWALSLHNGDPASALALYRRSRRAHVWVYQMLSAAFTPQYQSNSRALPLLRDHILTPMSKMPLVRDILGSLVRGTLVPPVAGEPYANALPLGLRRRDQDRGCL